ncbi:unnamed protein product [Cyberlindnera jadinii]|uniref:Uncharacterized protein n=1 Tax=Cyberlindnera jadinii (strain ATCC 18201 / CBS 1600 / BCRC 20928 / JCM 3617 / NBRC 0987 / NRRL Y-1542) TaxID=983966 RepID=A0A0H5C9C2_CYBJN|nr:unnamed protein product [Cyberlindnera jadinii]
MTLLYYYEVLERIRSVSIVVELLDGSLSSWDAFYDSKSHILTVLVGDEQIAIELSDEIPELSKDDLRLCTKQNKQTLVMRLPMDGAGKFNRDFNELMSLSTHYKWDAKFLASSSFQLHCRDCDSPILDSDDISSLNEMPSELWAEMMDFWHCHKPHDENGHGHIAHDNTKYTSLKPIKNGVLVGTFYLAFNSNDNLFKVRMDHGSCVCAECGSPLGNHDNGTGLDKINKWRVVLSRDKARDTYHVYDYVYSSLLDNVNASAARVVEYTDGTSSLLVWVFNTNISYKINEHAPEEGMKLYYTTDPEDIAREREARGEFEVIDVDSTILKGTVHHLDDVNNTLPPSIRNMSTWRLSLLHCI